MAKTDTSRQPLQLPTMTVAQLNAADLLAAGKLDREVGEAVGVSRQTVCGWRHHPVFAAELNRRRAELWSASIDKLRAMVSKSLDRAADALDGPDPLSAALAILRLCGVGSIDLSSIGPTDAVSIIDNIAQLRRTPPPRPLDMLDSLFGEGEQDKPVTDDERRAVLADIRYNSEYSSVSQDLD